MSVTRRWFHHTTLWFVVRDHTYEGDGVTGRQVLNFQSLSPCVFPFTLTDLSFDPLFVLSYYRSLGRLYHHVLLYQLS